MDASGWYLQIRSRADTDRRLVVLPALLIIPNFAIFSLYLRFHILKLSAARAALGLDASSERS